MLNKLDLSESLSFYILLISMIFGLIACSYIYVQSTTTYYKTHNFQSTETQEAIILSKIKEN
jgi:hypothetical protein